jgi:hypothetical protein
VVQIRMAEEVAELPRSAVEEAETRTAPARLPRPWFQQPVRPHTTVDTSAYNW